MSMIVIHASETRAETSESEGLGRHRANGTDRVSELEGFLLIRVEVVVRGDCEDGSRLKLLQQLEILLPELIKRGTILQRCWRLCSR